MGRYYKSARPQNIDYAFEFPLQALAYAANKKDQEIDDTYTQLEGVEASMNEQKSRNASSTTKSMYAPEDEEAYNAELGRMEGEIDAIATNISGDVMNAGKYQQDIRKLRTNVGQSFNSGTMYNINKNAGTLDTWVKENKDKDPALVNAILADSTKKWGGTMGEGGKFNTLSLPTVYDKSTSAVALTSAKSVSKTIPEGERLSHTVSLMADDKELISSIGQQLQYGLLRDEDGVVIDPENLTYEEQMGYIQGEIVRKAESAVRMTRKVKDPKTGKTPKVKEEDKKYQGTKHTGRNATVKNTLGIIEDNRVIDGVKVGSYDAAKHMLVKNRAVLENVETIPTIPTTINNVIENTILEQEIKKADAYAVQKYKTQSFTDMHPSNTIDELRQEYFDQQVKVTTPISTDGWAEETTNAQKATAVKQLKDITPSQLNEYTIYSDNENLNGKSINQLMEDGVIGYKEKVQVQKDLTKAQSELETKLEFEEEGVLSVDDKVIKKKLDDGSFEYRIQFTMDEDKANTDNNSFNESLPVKESNPLIRYMSVPIEYTNEKDFKISTDKASPSQIMDENGNGRIRLEATYKGESIAVYMDDSELKIPAIDEAKKARPTSTDPTKTFATNEETNRARMYFRKAKHSLNNNSKITLVDGITLVKDIDGNVSIFEKQPVGNDVEFKGETQVVAYLSTLIANQ